MKSQKDEWIVIKNHHESIITREEFDKVQEILKNNNSKLGIDGKVDLFYGYLICGDCGSKFKKSSQYYYCENYARNKKCTKHSFNKDKLIYIVLKNIKEKHKKYRNIKELNRQLLFKVVENIVIFENKDVKINYK